MLFVSQKAKLSGANVSYTVRDQHGLHLGAVEEVGRGLVKRALDRRPPDARTYRLQVVDSEGRVLMKMIRPRAWLKSNMIVQSADGSAMGEIAQDRLGVGGAFATLASEALTQLSGTSSGAARDMAGVGHARFRLQSRGRPIGVIHTESLQGWDFRITDTDGNIAARVTKEWAGWAKERFTNADNYAIEIFRPQPEPLRSLIIASALAVDLALKQGQPTTGRGKTRRYH